MRSVEPGRSPRLLAGISVYWLSLSFLTDGLTTLVLPNDLERYAGESKATALGVLTFVGLSAAMVVQPLAGALSDRIRGLGGRRGTIGLGLALTLPALALYAVGGLAAVAAGYVLTLCAASVSQAGQQGFIPDLVPRERRGLASGLKGFMDLAGATLGFVLLGQAVGAGGSRSGLLVIASVLVAGYLLTLALVREPRVPSAAPSPRLRGTFRIDRREHRTFVLLVTARFLFLLGAYIVGRFFLFFVGDRLELDPARAAEQAGALLGALTLVTLLAGPAAGWLADRIGRSRVMSWGALLGAAGPVLLLWAREPWHILLFGSVMSLGTAFFTAANWASTADVVPPAEAGRFFGLANVGTMGAAAVAGLLGPLVDLGNRQEPGAGYGIALTAAALAALAALQVVRRLAAAERRSDASAGFPLH
jgi:MFS family permease